VLSGECALTTTGQKRVVVTAMQVMLLPGWAFSRPLLGGSAD
jgi:hypothetical protein